jgi:peptidoglycan/LPS O-acetylase OafA/YrhL
LKRIAELDGIRGLAITAILIVHSSELLVAGINNKPIYYALYRVMYAGWLGVDMFFVLSGFLITTIVLADRLRPDFWSRFYLRRSLRILPAFAVVFAVIVLAIHFLMPEIHLTAAEILPAIFFAENWTILNGKGMPMLQHVWSLSVEEQFYLLWPQIVKRCSIRTIFRVSIGLAVADELLRIALAMRHVNPYIIYAITPTRMDGLALGAALATGVTLPGPQRFLAAWWRMIALLSVGMLVAAFFIEHSTIFPGSAGSQIMAIPPTILLTAMLIYGAITSALPSTLARFLANPVLTYLGRRSYALYLIHLPILIAAWQDRLHGRLSLLRAGFLVNALLVIIFVGISLALTEISWRLVESPALSLRQVIERKRMTDATAEAL